MTAEKIANDTITLGKLHDNVKLRLGGGGGGGGAVLTNNVVETRHLQNNAITAEKIVPATCLWQPSRAEGRGGAGCLPTGR